MDAFFDTFLPAPIAYTVPEYAPFRADEFDTIMPSTDPTFESLFDFDRWAADAGVAPTWNDFAFDAFDASNAFNYTPQDAVYPSYMPQDAPAPAFDAFASFVASIYACGWADRDHVTTFGPDSTAPLPYPFVSPTDICDLVPVVPQFEDEEEQEEVVAVEELEFDMALLEQVDQFLASLGQQALQAEPAAVIDEPVNEPDISVKPSASRPCKRRRPDHDDADIYPAPPKKCARRPRTPAHASSSSTPRSQSPAFDKSTLPKPIVVVRAAVLCPMPGCDVVLSTKDSAWRSHFRIAHHADVCADSSCAASGSCERACPLPKADGSPCGAHMTVDSLGRHVLNKHIGVVYRCPVCGLEKPQRLYAAERHIKTCLRNSLKAAWT
ncbi:hypothetical protein TRAPUB_5146 [Trametes pubescens]|uniref:Uncharacterized protein n=1 Tax=Trametes pubescens TaxID=154538 RepID=A0A1M2V9B4_TRAPU|nr:hypothetical protein TRAPUB_5146 [Trametes pubescens]